MATKGERFRYEVERAGSARPKKAPKKKASAATGQSLGRKAMFALEVTPDRVPASRKSTRRSKHRQKAATLLTGRTMLVKTSPKARHDAGRASQRAPR